MSDVASDRILAAATDLFAERSYDGATMRDIAARAGVTQPLVSYHFGSKLELWQACVDALFARLTRTIDDRIAGLRGVDETTTAKLLVHEFIVFSARNPQLHRIITQESKADGPRMDHLVEHHVRAIYERTTALFRALTEQGIVPPIPPEHLYYILTGAGPTMFVLGPECRRLTGLDPADDDVVEAHAAAVCRLLFGEP